MKQRKPAHTGLKKWTGRLHLWLGMLSGLIVFIAAVTGCMYVFHDEIKDLTRDYRYVAPSDDAYVSPSALREFSQTLIPEAAPGMVVYPGKNRPAIVHAAVGTVPYQLYFNPYSGKFLAEENMEEDFFALVEDLHMHLWLPPETGKQVVGISTLIFLFMIISGIILWWPKKLKHLKERLKVKWKARWRRVNYDWHSVSGFYIAVLGLVIAITGLNFSYEWVSSGLYELGNLGTEAPQDEINMKVSDSGGPLPDNLLDLAFYQTIELAPDAQMYFVWEQGKDHLITTGAYPEAFAYDHQSNFYFHPETGELVKTHYYSEKSPGMKLQEMTYGLHTGQYFGLTGKIIAFLASLMIACLPVSGFLIWCGRRKKSRKTLNQGRNAERKPESSI